MSKVEIGKIARAVAPVANFEKINVGYKSIVIREFELMKLLKGAKLIWAVEKRRSCVPGILKAVMDWLLFPE
jgi:hypothetical protein